MLDRLMWWRKPKPPETLLEKLQANKGGCPDCGGVLLLGPEGGCAVNVKCDACEHRFNIGMGPDGPFYVERLGVK